jgi:aryl-alcohol dehydrogenase-like predicted oxidoreductase
VEYRQLGRTGLKVSMLGYGASPLGGVFARTGLPNPPLLPLVG